MRSGDGSDLLGANDPRSASIGIIYVAPTDDRPSVLEAILMQDKLGRKQVAVVLPENSRAFQRPVDFDGLKNMRRGLKAEIIFVAPGVPGAAEFARQRRFTVYTSLESYATALRAELPDNGNAKKGLFNRKPRLVPNVNAPSPITTVPSADDVWKRHSPSSRQDVGSYVTPVVPMTEDEDAKSVRPRPKPGPTPIPLPPGPRGYNVVASPSAKSGGIVAGTASEKQMPDEQIIYLDPNDGLTSVREKIEAVPARRFIMVMPQQTQLRSNVGWRLLHARARELGKEIRVISPDRQVRAVAKAAGFLVSQPTKDMQNALAHPQTAQQNKVVKSAPGTGSVGTQPVPREQIEFAPSSPLPPAELPAWMNKLDKMGDRSIAKPLAAGQHPAEPPQVENPPTNTTRSFSPLDSRLPQRELRIKVWEDDEELSPSLIPEQRGTTFSPDMHDIAPDVADIPTDVHQIEYLDDRDEDDEDYLPPADQSTLIRPYRPVSSGSLSTPSAGSRGAPPPLGSKPPTFEILNIIDHTGEIFGNYHLVTKIATGNLGDVYLGEHVQLGTKAALKILSTRIDREEFQNGMRRLARLIHPNIMRILDFGLKELTPFLVMDYAPNGTLSHRHSNQHSNSGLVPLNIIVDYVKQIVSAVQYAHDQNIALGNVQPENMLIGSNNEILLGGLDSSFIDSTKEGVTSIGKYTAPEQTSGKTLPASDQYALGVIVYEWLCGQPPLSFKLFENHHEKVVRLISSPPIPLLQKIPSLLPGVEEIVMKALAKEPKQRFESIQAFADALEHTISPGNTSHGAKHIGQQFGNYRLMRLLGEGGFADVYLGKHIHLNTSVAVKILHTRLTSEDVEAFRTEARTLANLRHSNIVRVLDFEVEEGIPFLVMDHAPNGTLRQRHPKGSRLPLNIIVSYVKQVANALQYAHDQKLIHRDVKPENMLLWHNNEILLSDFGIAVVAHSSRSVHTEKEAGTVYYMAPEQSQGKPQLSSDQYSLAVVVYEWLTGICPFTGTLLEIISQHLTATPPSLRLKVSTIPRAVEEVVLIALAKDPKKRFNSVQAFAKALEEASKH